MAAIAKRVLDQAGLWEPANFPYAKPFYEGVDKERALERFLRSTHPEKIVFVLDNIDTLGPHMHLLVHGLTDDALHLNEFHGRFFFHPALFSDLDKLSRERLLIRLSAFSECIRIWLSTTSAAMLSFGKWGHRSSHPMLKTDKIDTLLKMFRRFRKFVTPCLELSALDALEHRLRDWREQVAQL